jgi:hypothetical protein
MAPVCKRSDASAFLGVIQFAGGGLRQCRSERMGWIPSVGVGHKIVCEVENAF